MTPTQPTLAGALERHAASKPEATAFRFLENGEGDGVPRTFGELAMRARAIAHRLLESTRPGDRALLVYPSGLEFIDAFFGCAMAGVVAVPCAPLERARPERARDRVRAIQEHSRAATVLTASPDAESVTSLFGDAPSTVIATDRVPTSDGSLPCVPGATGAVPVLIQYTSGSTGAPRGVVLRHAHLIANAEAIRGAFGVTRARGVSWLPLHHDMGLIGHVIAPVWYGDESILMAPLSFVRRPGRWLRAIGRFGARESGGPNFAYEACVRRVSEAERAELDLRSWEIAYSGAEPIRAGTLRRFADTFAAAGFRASSFCPCYGLAESTLMVTSGAPQRGFQTAEHTSRASAREVVGCGRARPGTDVMIVDADSRRECAPGAIGEIWTRGPSVAAGYFEDAASTKLAFGAKVAGSETGGFLRTGDLGFMRDGELFVVGRMKDLLIAHGRKINPEDLEATAERSHALVRIGGVVAFATSEEEVIVVCEVSAGETAPRAEVIAAARAAIAREHDVNPAAVLLVAAGSLPRTSSGKVTRTTSRSRFEEGALESLLRA